MPRAHVDQFDVHLSHAVCRSTTMAVAPSGKDLLACMEAVAVAERQQGNGTNLCEHCGERPERVFCSFCRISFCAECDAAVHVRGLKNHTRVPCGERPLFCSVHNEEFKGFCQTECRLACATCLIREIGNCASHAISSLPDTAAAARAQLQTLLTHFQKEEEKFDVGIRDLSALRADIDAAIAVLGQARSKVRATKQIFTEDPATADTRVIDKTIRAIQQAKETQKALIASLGDQAALRENLLVAALLLPAPQQLRAQWPYYHEMGYGYEQPQQLAAARVAQPYASLVQKPWGLADALPVTFPRLLPPTAAARLAPHLLHLDPTNCLSLQPMTTSKLISPPHLLHHCPQVLMCHGQPRGAGGEDIFFDDSD
eukprot:m.22326 g.22326  ORF g.22326 m.22326 type:complete len:371 (-) comp8277_c0_seq1:62-1174(-)